MPSLSISTASTAIAVVSLTAGRTEWVVEEGTWIEGPRTRVAVVTGPACRVLQGERLALNLLARLSGIATRTHRVVEKVKRGGWKGRVAGSRKTTPGFRLFEKYALAVGGADCHRFDLSSCVMLKDNHIDVVGSIEKALVAARSVAGFTRKIEVECRKVEDALLAAAAGADIVMLDNFAWIDANLAAEKLKSTHPHVVVEVSGGITEENVVDFAHASIDVISMGSLTQGVPTVDFSLKIIV